MPYFISSLGFNGVAFRLANASIKQLGIGKMRNALFPDFIPI